ncbi:type II secretion system F family protein [Blautia sp. Marseille-P3201T]|uniref:type II secretion system F family protein n=1 Tax=Blautia sp. Marseille-P3201T TaxID=1907659 RepID=UPI000B193919|nr:type II secretion system F family protein [Blautia sp. Marseille-P3201T]
MTFKKFYMAASIILVGNLLGIGIFIKEEKEKSMEYLERNPYGEGAYEETLVAETKGKTQEITVYVDEKNYTEKEMMDYIKEAKQELNQWIKKVEKRCENFEFPQTLKGNPVRISWSTGNPDILSWEGIPGKNISENGENVEIIAAISLGEETEIWKKQIMVYPPKLNEREKMQREVQKEAELLSKNPSGPLYLPQTLEGEEIRYKKTGSNTGRIVCFLSFVLGFGVYPLQKEKEKKKQESIRKEMQKDYPDIIQKLVLFLRAGFTIRRAMEKIAEGYLRSREKYQMKERSAYEEIVRTCKEMQGGIYEAEAYERFGVRCEVSQYKVLSVLLVQNLKKGNQNLLELLEREEAVAEDERKRSAKVRGEEASTKLLLPMMLQLIVVLMILMIPAFFSFL